jgi:magnesium transporter
VEEYLGANTEVWKTLADASPHDVADILESVSADTAGELVSLLNREQSASVFEELRDELAATLLEELPSPEAASVLEKMPSEEAVDILEKMPTDTVASLINLMGDPAGAEVSKLFHYPSDTAGGLMTTDVAVLPVGLTAGEAIERIRNIREMVEDLTYVYITDDFGTLRGVVSFRDLVFVRPAVGLDEAMEANPVAVSLTADREKVSELMQRYRLLGLPVVDDRGHLQGMVTYDEVIDAVQAEASEDFAASVGAGAEESIHTPVLSSVRMRLPWLSLNLLLAMIVAFVIERQTGVISSEPVLAALMPVVALLGGNGGVQSLAVVIRSMAVGDLPRARIWTVLRRQLGIGILNGAFLALAAMLLTVGLLSGDLFSSNFGAGKVAPVVGLAALANLAIATLAGSGIPIVLRRMGFDPALASSIFLTLITDVVGFGGFLMVAAALL